MITEPRITTPFDSLGMCTWMVVLGSGLYVYDPDNSVSVGYDMARAHVWLDEKRARAWADVTKWAGKIARVVRARA